MTVSPVQTAAAARTAARANRQIAVRETEAGFQGWVIDTAHTFGWRVAHFGKAWTEKGWRTPVRADGAGFFDLVLVRGDRCIFAEVKTDRGQLEALQGVWRRDMAATGNEVYLWRPADRAAIEACLGGRR